MHVVQEFYIDQVNSSDEFRFFCVDRTKNEPYSGLPLREDVSACPGFIGKGFIFMHGGVVKPCDSSCMANNVNLFLCIHAVSVPLSRLPEGEEIEQWYPLVPKETYLSLRTALRIALCFTPSGKARLRVDSMAQLQRRIPGQNSQLVSSSSATSELSLPSPVGAPSKLRIQIQIPPSPIQSPVSISLKTGVIDYVIVVGPTGDAIETSDARLECQENSLLFRYPATDRPHFPLPTKIEWFCFPGGPEVITQASRPPSKLFSFVLVGGDDGMSRTYAVCLTVYHRPKVSSSSSKRREADKWHATCVAFLTRVPLVDELKECLLAVAHAWLGSKATMTSTRDSEGLLQEAKSTMAEELLVDLCHRVLIPIRGVFGVQFSVANTPISLVLPTNVSIYNNGGGGQSRLSLQLTKRPSLVGKFSPTKSPSTNFINIQQGFQPLVYSLAPIFQLFDIKTVVHLVALILCEYRVLIHSAQFSLLCPFAEGLCALIYPFRWQHPYVPILPRVLSEYLQAPLPYILGVHTSWLPELLENGRPEHLVIVDIDRGAIQLQESQGPMLPSRLTKGLYQRIKRIIHPDVFDQGGTDFVDGLGHGSASHSNSIQWDATIEKQVRVEFVCYLSAMLMGYRDCLFFVNQKLPVFNKRRYFSTCASDNEVVPFVTRLFCTQAFQGFLENHSSSELSVFHSVYLTFSRSKDLEWPQSMPPMSISSHATAATRANSSLGRTGGRESSTIVTPVFTIPQTSETELMDDDVERNGSETAAPNSQDAMEHDDSAVVLDEFEPSAPPNLGVQIEELLDLLSGELSDPFVMSIAELESESAKCATRCCDYKQMAQGMGVDPRILEDNAELFRDPHQVNQNQGLHHMGGNGGHSGAFGGPNTRSLSNEEERTEQVLHKCLTSVFASDDMITPEDVRVRVCD